MFRYVVLCLMALLNSANADEGEPPIESMDTDKKKKRREQNVQAAKKSYEAKKKERSDLQTKNTELYETQMKLMHDKSRLQERTMLLERIIDAMNHQCLGPSSDIPCHTETRSVCRTTLSNKCHSPRSYPYNNGIKLEPLNDNNMALDLSARATRHESHSTKALPVADTHYNGAQVDTKDNVQIKMDDEYSDDGHIVDCSTLGIGATQEVELHVAPRRKMRHSRDNKINEDSVFIPETKPKKSRRDSPAAASRPARGCAADAMKKQRAAALCPRGNRASSY